MFLPGQACEFGGLGEVGGEGPFYEDCFGLGSRGSGLQHFQGQGMVRVDTGADDDEVDVWVGGEGGSEGVGGCVCSLWVSIAWAVDAGVELQIPWIV